MNNTTIDTTEKRFESDIEAFFLSSAGGFQKGTDAYDPKLGLYLFRSLSMNSKKRMPIISTSSTVKLIA